MNVVVYGATGWTGALTAKEAERLGYRVILAGRSAQKLAEVRARLRARPEIRLATLTDRAALEKALAGADVVINCAGPYIESGPPLIEAAIAARCHYVDSSGENSYVRSLFDRYSDGARKRGVTIASAFGPKGAFGDWAAAVAANGVDAIKEVRVCYGLGVREYFQPTATSVLAIAAQGLFKTHDDYDRAYPISRAFDFPAPFGTGTGLLAPTTDDITVPQHVPVSIVRTYVALAPGSPANAVWANFCAAGIAGVPAFSALLGSNPELLRILFREPYTAMTGDSFVVLIEVEGAKTIARLAISLRDAYAITTDVLLYGARRALEPDAPRGVVAPSVLCSPRAALKHFVAAGLIRAKRGT